MRPASQTLYALRICVLAVHCRKTADSCSYGDGPLSTYIRIASSIISSGLPLMLLIILSSAQDRLSLPESAHPIWCWKTLVGASSVSSLI
ncbi:hypothetical protein F4779DRAFT_607529 [Xylariaceae sp. FL0662B]|nr:hypothetical protein F4779DRAFT_607529 [Xylariaceae sp. FL0662B]